MPHLGVIMERSLQERSFREGLVDLVARSVVGGLSKRQNTVSTVQNGIADVRLAFSSWDNCMAATYCKWPVIGIIAIGGLILISIIWCCARCLCCGRSCCCECCYCLKCCGQCCGLCDPPRGKRSKYLDEPYIPPHHDQAYRSQPNMTPGFPDIGMRPEPPQYAEFDSGAKKDADSLPAMPSWEGAGSKKVYLEEESVEMEPLKKPESTPTVLMNAGNASQPTIANSTSPEARNPYGPPQGQPGLNGYMAATNTNASTYASGGQSYGSYDNAGYGQGMDNYSDQGYGATGMTAQGSQSPQQDYSNTGFFGAQISQGYPQSQTPRPYNDELGRHGTPGPYGLGAGQQTPNNGGYGGPARVASPAAQSGYGYDDPIRRPSPGPNAAYGYGDANRRPSPGPNAAYGYGQRSNTPGTYSQRSNTPGGQNRPYPPPPQRQYSTDTNQQYSQDPEVQYSADASQPYPAPRRQFTGDNTQQYPQPDYSSESIAPLTRPTPGLDNFEPSSPIRNNSGFDFTSGYSRPTSPAVQTANGGKAYPGYRPYKPQQDE